MKLKIDYPHVHLKIFQKCHLSAIYDKRKVEIFEGNCQRFVVPSYKGI